MSLMQGLSIEQLQFMAAAGFEARDCQRVLHKVKANLVGEILKNQGKFYEMQHYPKGDVYDGETHSQYYYHAHRKDADEHGHFHTFLRAKGMPKGVRPVPYDGKEVWPAGDEALSHIIAISMDKGGLATHLFTTNRWVTAETWYTADDVIAMMDRFAMDHAWPSWPTNRWITAMMVLFRPQIERLLRQRDAAIADWKANHPDGDVFEDRKLEITSIAAISLDDQITAVTNALDEAEKVV